MAIEVMQIPRGSDRAGDGSLRPTLPGISSAHRHATTLRVNAITTSL
jgi:hypothetical protein